MAEPTPSRPILAIIHGFSLRNLRGDIYGRLTAAVVALSLALAFGVASGAGPVAGLHAVEKKARDLPRDERVHLRP